MYENKKREIVCVFVYILCLNEKKSVFVCVCAFVYV